MKIDASPIITSARTVAVLSGPDGDLEHALRWAEAHGTRLFTRAEAQYLFEASNEFRGAVKGCWFWVLESTPVNSDYRAPSWVFNGDSGVVYAEHRNFVSAVRCVGQSNE